MPVRILLIKTSSLGDILHAFPALTDASKAHPGIRFDWVVEEAFMEMPIWHPAVDRVIPVALRRWRRKPWRFALFQELRRFFKMLRERQYDLVIDAQGLLKSGVITAFTRGCRYGLDRHSAREPLAVLFYHVRIPVSKKNHAINRLRQLFAVALRYPFSLSDRPDSNLRSRLSCFSSPPISVIAFPYLVVLHGTTWETKQWPEPYWRELLERIVTESELSVVLPCGNRQEQARAKRLAAGLGERVRAAPPATLHSLATLIAGAKGVVAVDTGPAHLAAALGIPSITLYGATDPKRTGTCGPYQYHLTVDTACAPCFARHCLFQREPLCYQTLPPKHLWQALKRWNFIVGCVDC